MLLEIIILMIILNDKAKYCMSLPWDHLVDQTVQSNQRPVYLDLSQPRQYKVKFQRRHCKIDKRLWFFLSVSVYPVNENLNVKMEENLVITNKKRYNLREYSLLVNLYSSRVRDDI